MQTPPPQQRPLLGLQRTKVHPLLMSMRARYVNGTLLGGVDILKDETLLLHPESEDDRRCDFTHRKTCQEMDEDGSLLEAVGVTKEQPLQDRDAGFGM